MTVLFNDKENTLETLEDRIHEERVESIILRKVQRTQLGMLSIFIFTLILNPILSLFADPDTHFTPSNGGDYVTFVE